MTTRTLARLRGLAALTLLIGIVVGVPALLAALHLLPHSLPSAGQVGASLRQRDNGQLAIGIIAAATWLCWALFTLSLVPEILATARHRPAKILPGLGMFQRPAAALVAVIAIGFTLVPAAVVTSGTPAHAAALPALTSTISWTGLATAPVAPGHQNPTAAAASAGRQSAAHDGVDRKLLYEVVRRDTLWAIAERHLGDPLRYPEIVRLNPTKIGPDNEITPGTHLRLPADATGLGKPKTHVERVETGGTTFTVHPDDTLWDIAQDQSGDGQNWHQLWAANKNRTEPHGERFTDPDLIKPGWTLSRPVKPSERPKRATEQAPFQSHSEAPTPSPTRSPLGASDPPAAAERGPATPTTGQPALPGSATSPLGATSNEPLARVSAGQQPTRDSRHAVVAFGGTAGATLAALIGLALARHRRRQTRHRRPGRVIAGTAPDLVHLEQVMAAVAATGQPDVTWLDHALRGLAQQVAADPEGHLPDLIAASISDTTLTLVLAEPAHDAPTPWTANDEGLRWTVNRSDPLPYQADRRQYSLAPYPTLASIGRTTAGEHWLIDLERVGNLTLTGDPARGRDLARFIAAELAHNTWSEMLHATLVGFGEELTPANPDRLTHYPHLAEALPAITARAGNVCAALDRLGIDMLHGRLHNIAPDAWAPHVLLLAADPLHQNDIGELDAALSAHARAGLAVVNATGTSSSSSRSSSSTITTSHRRGWVVEVDRDGMARIPALGIEIVAAQLPEDEAAPLARMLAMAANTRDQPTPAARGDQPWDAHADACGALTDELTDQHGSEGELAQSRTAGPSDLPNLHLAPTLAPRLDGRHGRSGTPDPLATGADTNRERVEAADPTLDADLVAWTDPDCPRPRVALLGRVQVRARGSLPTDRPREPFHAEVVAYLSTRTRGVPSHEYATAIWPGDPEAAGKSKVTNSISVVRSWLGQDPATGKEYLPLGWYEAGSAFYRIPDALIDAELFRRLRVRGLARGGPSGSADLQRALELVTGRPFDHPEPREGAPGGYAWLAEANSRLDHEYSAMIVDTAHTLAQHHIACGDYELAAEAAQVSLKADSYEDVPLLDLVEASMAQQKLAEAETYVQRILTNHDAEIEEDLPPRTAEVLFRLRRTWTEQAS